MRGGEAEEEKEEEDVQTITISLFDGRQKERRTSVGCFFSLPAGATSHQQQQTHSSSIWQRTQLDDNDCARCREKAFDEEEEDKIHDEFCRGDARRQLSHSIGGSGGGGGLVRGDQKRIRRNRRRRRSRGRRRRRREKKVIADVAAEVKVVAKVS